jgi:Bacteriophage Sf6, terminase small subunit-like
MRARSKSRSIQVPAKVGRSTKYSLEWAEGFCALIAEGHSVVEICAKPDMPSQQSVYTWLRDNEDFLERYARAREAQADKLFKECLTIADAARPEDANVARLRVDTRKWAAARLAPKKYGDRVSHDVKGAGSNFQPQILISCSSAGEDEGYLELHATSEAAGSLPQQGNGNLVRGSGGGRI